MYFLKRMFGIEDTQTFNANVLEKHLYKDLEQKVVSSNFLARSLHLYGSISLIHGERLPILLAFINSAYYIKTKYSGRGKYVIPWQIFLELHPSNDFPHGGSFLNRLRLTSDNYGEQVDKIEGTVVIPEDLPVQNVELIRRLPENVSLKVLSNNLFIIEFLDLKDDQRRRSKRQLVAESGNTQVIISGDSVLWGRNVLCGRNSGSRYTWDNNVNVIRLDSDEFPEDFAEINVMSDKDVRIMWKNNTVRGRIDSKELRADNQWVSFKIDSRLVLGQGTFGLFTLRLD